MKVPQEYKGLHATSKGHTPLLIPVAAVGKHKLAQWISNSAIVVTWWLIIHDWNWQSVLHPLFTQWCKHICIKCVLATFCTAANAHQGFTQDFMLGGDGDILYILLLKSFFLFWGGGGTCNVRLSQLPSCVLLHWGSHCKNKLVV